ncbi:MAG: cell division protein ZapE [Methylococcaceae bacterium]|jgi:cell division protein ZapE
MTNLPKHSAYQHLLLAKQYEDLVARKQIKAVPEQLIVLNKLQLVIGQLVTLSEYQEQPILKKFLLKTPAKPRGIYLFGKVGGGKSLLMNLFYQACPITQKRRVHFHAFMREVHAFVKHYQQQNRQDVMAAFVKQLKASTLVLCFDEFQVTDIVDAMLLGRLFQKMFESGISIIITSNVQPIDLYRDGLQRELFLPFIALLQQQLDVFELDSEEDHRLQWQSLAKTYYAPLNAQADDFIRHSFQQLTGTAEFTAGILKVLGRQLTLTAVHQNIALTTFDELCGRPLGAADYLRLAMEYEVLILANIPQLTIAKRNEAKRFITLIDVLYEYQVKLICSAEVLPQALYRSDLQHAFEFERTVSRLMEMQSAEYFNKQRTATRV